MVRRYELMIILDPNQSDEVIKEQIDKIENLIKSTEGGEILNIDNWGKKRLAYEIQGRPFGVYVVYEFNMDSTGTTELERHCRLDALNLRHLLLHVPVKVLKLKASEKELKSSLEDRRRRMAEQSEESPVVDLLQTVEEEPAVEGDDSEAKAAEAEETPKSEESPEEMVAETVAESSDDDKDTKKEGAES